MLAAFALARQPKLKLHESAARDRFAFPRAPLSPTKRRRSQLAAGGRHSKAHTRKHQPGRANERASDHAADEAPETHSDAFIFLGECSVAPECASGGPKVLALRAQAIGFRQILGGAETRQRQLLWMSFADAGISLLAAADVCETRKQPLDAETLRASALIQGCRRLNSLPRRRRRRRCHWASRRRICRPRCSASQLLLQSTFDAARKMID